MLKQERLLVKAGTSENVPASGKYLRVKDADIEFNFQTARGDNFTLSEGDEVNLEQFEYIKIYNPTAADEYISFQYGDTEKVGSSKVNGNLQVTAIENNGGLVQTNPAVTNATTQVLAANSARKYLLIQNKDIAGKIYIVFGAAATVALGIELNPKQTLALENFCSNQAVNIIGDIALNSNVVVIEG